ncbi:SseB family protein [Kitasatospora indigofera]|uniref:SseB family protein n=1 Tax=Kitasatospora indigofera TaxID=67307 RepID=UPI001E4D520B|nr:SseB family protein [Kitasatospora indigofera]
MEYGFPFDGYRGGRMSNAGLVHAVRMVRAGAGDPGVMVGAFRSSVVFVPRDADGRVWSGDEGGIRWLFAFSSEAAMAAFARARGHGGPELEYLTVRGSRLLDVAVGAVGRPCGVALDVAGAEPMLFPPVRGIVADAVALDGEGKH